MTRTFQKTVVILSVYHSKKDIVKAIWIIQTKILRFLYNFVPFVRYGSECLLSPFQQKLLKQSLVIFRPSKNFAKLEEYFLQDKKKPI